MALALKKFPGFDFEGFLEPESLIVAHHPRYPGTPSKIQLWDGKDGRLINSFVGPSPEDQWTFTRNRDFFIGVDSTNLVRDDKEIPLSSLNLRTGVWRVLPDDLRKYMHSANNTNKTDFHRNRPLLLAWSQSIEEPEDAEDFGVVLVFDLNLGREVFRWPGGKTDPSRGRLGTRPFFIGDQLGIPIKRPAAPSKVSQCALEIWGVDTSNAPIRIIENLCIGDDPVASKTRVAWAADGHADWIDVYDLEVDRMVFSYPPDRSGPAVGSENSRPLIFGDEHTLFAASRIWDIGTGEEISPRRTREVVRAVDEGGWIENSEEWDDVVWNLMPIRTFVLRRAENGEFVQRTWHPTLIQRSRDGALFFNYEDGAVHRLPPRVNYPLLALCQTILATPLVLLWAVLRWRRNRRMRLASVAP